MATADNSFLYEGGADGVLLIHGLTGTPTEMKFVGKGLARTGFTVYGMQLAGHCGTEADLLATSWHDWSASVEQAYAVLAQRCERVFVAGLSVGAVLALHLAAQNPKKIAGLGLYSTTLRYDGWAIPRLSFLLPLVLCLPFGKRYHFVESHPYGIKDERLRKRVVANMFSGNSGEAGLSGTPGMSLRELWKLVAAVKKEMPAITTPALIVHSSIDDVTSTWNARYVQRHLGGPTRTVLLDNCYHMITVDQQRREVAECTAQYFHSLTQGNADKTAAGPRDCHPGADLEQRGGRAFPLEAVALLTP
ncbi:MAG: alpha/beta fold hydrolase [Humidesulfovibrio sp.]|nr:alpha/beta fold hydrolase [Humidesulfovibrio sp.]